MEVAINVNSKSLKFVRCRRPSGVDLQSKVLNGLFYHAVYMRTEEQMWSKINSWGHAHQTHPKDWFQNVWQQWNQDTRNLHYSRGGPVFKAVEEILPDEINKIVTAIKEAVENAPSFTLEERDE